MSETQDNSGSVQDPFRWFQDMQKQWMDAIGMMSAPKSEDPSPADNPFDPMQAAKLWSESLRQILNTTMGQSASSNDKTSGMYDHLQQAAKSYAAILNLFSGFAQSAGETNKASDSNPFASNPFAQAGAWMPDPLSAASGYGSAAPWLDAAGKMASNWTKFSTNMAQQAAAAISDEEAGPDAAKDFYSRWLNVYENTIGRFVKLPTLGPARYDLEKVERSIDAAIKYQAALYDYQTQMLKTGVDSLQEVMADAAPIFAKEITDDTFDEFFNILLNVGEKHYHELFTSEAFCHALDNLVSTGLDHQRTVSEMAEEMLKSTPIVTQSQADEMHREIYLLKKRVRDLERKANGQSTTTRGGKQ